MTNQKKVRDRFLRIQTCLRQNPPNPRAEPTAIGGKVHTARSMWRSSSVANLVALFHFRLDTHHGIGRRELLKLWSAACRSDEVAVSRVESAGSSRKTHTYSLLGSAKNVNIQDAENRIHDSLLKALPKATFVLRRY